MELIINKQEVTMMTLQIQHKVLHQNQQPPAQADGGTKMINVTIKVDNIDPQEGEDGQMKLLMYMYYSDK